MAWLGDQAWDATIHHGGTAPDEGWICPSLGVRVAAPRLRLIRRGPVERTTLLSVLAATTADTRRLAIAGADAGLLAIRVAQGSVADWITLDPAVLVLTPEGTIIDRQAAFERPVSVDDTALAACERRHAALAARQ
jgi:hypothetical protein